MHLSPPLQIAVALMNRFDEGDWDSGTVARGFAEYLHNAWDLGDVACENSLVLLLSVGNTQSFVSTGAGAKAALPDANVTAILEKMHPALRDGR